MADISIEKLVAEELMGKKECLSCGSFTKVIEGTTDVQRCEFCNCAFTWCFNCNTGFGKPGSVFCSECKPEMKRKVRWLYGR